MCGLQNRNARSLVNSARFHSHETVLYQIDSSNAMFAAYFIQFRQQSNRIEPLAVDRNRFATFESDLEIFSFVLRILRRTRDLKNVLRRLSPRIFENSALIRNMHQVA